MESRIPRFVRAMFVGAAFSRAVFSRAMCSRVMWAATVVLAMVVSANVADGCNIPVFRFALERWQSDPSEVIVFHRGALTGNALMRVQELEQACGASSHANLQLIRIDLQGEKPEGETSLEYRALWKQIERDQNASQRILKDQSLGSNEPWVVIRSRFGKDRILPHWQGPLNQLNAGELMDSPVRRELAKRLLSGDAVVWLVLKSSDAKKAASVSDMLSKQLASLPRKLELPDGVGLPGSELYSEVPLFLKFSVLEIDSSDPREAFLVSMLQSLNPQAVSAGESLVAPVFGRGRALEVIPAGDLTEVLVEDLTRFLSSACSCQVKEQNPGFDLVMSVNWNVELFGDESAPEMSAPARSRIDAVGEEPILVPIPRGKTGRSGQR
ncbi:MAG: hypothetical protein JNL58_20425 [Planctomyces sp.]|nr:hypothetical protein [Planctomyces sp.]